MKRNLTINEEQAIRQCHHDFDGKGIPEAAVCMGRSVRAVQRLLNSAKKKAPQMFPILTPHHRAILTLYDENISRKATAKGLGITEAVLAREVAFLREKGFLFNRTPDQYRPLMDGDVKTKF